MDALHGMGWDGWMHRRMDWWMDGLRDGLMYGYMGGLMDGVASMDGAHGSRTVLLVLVLRCYAALGFPVTSRRTSRRFPDRLT